MTARAEIREATLVHEFLPEVDLHSYTSPEVKGLFVTSETAEGARHEVLAVLERLFTRRGFPLPAMRFVEQTPERAAA